MWSNLNPSGSGLCFMNRIDERLASVRLKARPALVPYLTAGYPSIELTVPLASAVLSSGADMLELGIPFSDPLADGPTIQMTSFEALKNGMSVGRALEIGKEIRERDRESPLIFMGYFNPFLKYGTAQLLKDMNASGIDGIIVPDLPQEEAEVFGNKCSEYGVYLIPLLAPTSTDERIYSACEQAKGFVYCVSLTGVTGARSSLSSGVHDLVLRIREFTDLPVLVGFGISRKEDVRRISQFADGAVVGSAFLDAVSKASAGKETDVAADFVRALLP